MESSDDVVEMPLRRLGSRGPTISVVGYGAWEAGSTEWGAAPPDDHVVRAMITAFETGVTWIDTAEIYGSGRSEEMVAKAAKGWPDIKIFTKVASAPRGTGYRSNEVRHAAEASLRRLGRDVIDLYQLHWLDETDAPLEETWTAMAALVDAGLVRWIGVSNFAEEAIERCERIRHVDSLQPHLSMLWQERLSLVSFSKRNGIGVIAYGPLAFGLLTGTVTRRTRFPPDDWRSGSRGLRAYEQLFVSERLVRNLEVVERLKPIASRLGTSLAKLALAWVLHQPGVTGVIAGSRAPDHVRENASVGSVRLEPSDLVEIGSVLELRGELTHR
jgi:aryl-alcohol dehydrogenase-like predicted oxidoreductase